MEFRLNRSHENFPKKIKMKFLLSKTVGLLLITLLVIPGGGEAEESTFTFNRLFAANAELEKRFGIETLECFPLIENIGFTADQKPLIRQCLQGAETLQQALTDNPVEGLHTVSISDKFMWVGGFHGIQVPWGAGKEEVARFLSEHLPVEEQKRFLEKTRALKQKIASKIDVDHLYCTQKVSSTQCLAGYQNLLSAIENLVFKNKHWPEIVITDSFRSLKKPDALALKFDAPAEDLMNFLVFRDDDEELKFRKRIYDIVEEKYGEELRLRLHPENFICAVSLSPKECLQGADNLHKASLALQGRDWGIITIDRYNTFIQNDYDVTIRYDLNHSQVIRYFSVKPTTQETQKNHVLVEYLEKRAKDNSTNLRVVCDSEELGSALCIRGFETFLAFLKKRPDYRASEENLVLVDGDQLPQVNFALNSRTQKHYIYADANSSLEEFEGRLLSFAKIFGDATKP